MNKHMGVSQKVPDYRQNHSKTDRPNSLYVTRKESGVQQTKHSPLIPSWLEIFCRAPDFEPVINKAFGTAHMKTFMLPNQHCHMALEWYQHLVFKHRHRIPLKLGPSKISEKPMLYCKLDCQWKSTVLFRGWASLLPSSA